MKLLNPPPQCRTSPRSAVATRHATRHRRNAVQVELAQQVVVPRHRPLALLHLNQHARLVVRVRREHLRLLRRNRRVTRNQHRHHAAHRLQTQRQRRHIQQQQVVQLAARLRSYVSGSLHCCVAVHDRWLHSRSIERRITKRVFPSLFHFHFT